VNEPNNVPDPTFFFRHASCGARAAPSLTRIINNVRSVDLDRTFKGRHS
jgi:hypothetical protein